MLSYSKSYGEYAYLRTMSLMKSFAKETVVYGIGSILPRLLSFLFAALGLTRLFDPSDFGIHGIMYSFVAFVIVVVTFRMETAFFRFGRKLEDRLNAFNTTAWIVIVLSLSAFCITCLFSDRIASMLTDASDARYVRWFALIALFDATAAVPFALLRLENKAKRFAALKVFNAVFTVLLMLFFLLGIPNHFLSNTSSSFYAGWTRLDLIFLANAVASGLILLLLAPQYRGLQRRVDVDQVKQVLSYAWPLVIVVIAHVINNLSDRWFIKEFSASGNDLVASGIYNGCIKIAIFMTLFTTAFNYAAEPFFFKNADRKDSYQIYGQLTLAYTIVACIVFLGINMNIDLLKHMIDSEYHAGLGIVPIVSLAYLFLGIYYNFAIWYKLKDKTTVGAIIGIVGAIITISINIVLVPKISFYGSAIASLICFSSMCMMAYITGRKHMPIHYPLVKMGSYIGLSILIFVIFWMIRDQLNTILTLVVGNGIILALIAAAYRIDLKKIAKT